MHDEIGKDIMREINNPITPSKMHTNTRYYLRILYRKLHSPIQTITLSQSNELLADSVF